MTRNSVLLNGMGLKNYFNYCRFVNRKISAQIHQSYTHDYDENNITHNRDGNNGQL